MEALSAGIEPPGLSSDPGLVVDEDEIDISRHYSRNVEEYLTFHFMFVITICELAFDRRPIFQSAEQFQHWHLPETRTGQASFQARLDALRGFWVQIEHKVWDFMSANSWSSSGEGAVNH